MTKQPLSLLSPLEALITSKRIALFKKLLGHSLFEALCHLPSQIIQKQAVQTLTNDLIGQHVIVEVEVSAHEPSKFRRGPYRIWTLLKQSKQPLLLTFFNGRPQYHQRSFTVGKTYILSGKLEGYMGQFQLAHPKQIRSDAIRGSSDDSIEIIYPQSAGVTSKDIRFIVQNILQRVQMPSEWHGSNDGYPNLKETFIKVHNPKSQADFSVSSIERKRLLHDELLAHQLSFRLMRKQTKSKEAIKIDAKGELRAKVIENLPFTLTEGQIQALSDIQFDLKQGEPMLRLIQGDVGCGKTMVAALSLCDVIECGYQGSILVPTDILARQHFDNLSKLLSPFGVKVELLTGRILGAKRKKILSDLEAGDIDILIGTHALIQDHVIFKNLALVVVDEQHRFGVNQRAKLAQKGHFPHILSMTATPIPRTLQLTNYGDLDISIIKEKPAGRQAITTTLHPVDTVDEITAKLSQSVNSQNKAYWVCPLIEESENSDLAAATMRFENLRQIFGKRVGLLHGKMKAEEKNAAMEEFQSGEVDLLVSTTVIEVGVDVRSANIMVIEHAERFGLAQLHQLRGRVGRSSAKANCLLLYENLSEVSKQRLKVMRESDDGFYLAEADLSIRGSGDLSGLRQSGFPDFRFYKGDDYGLFKEILEKVKSDVDSIMKKDPELFSSRGQALQILLKLYGKDALTTIKLAA